MELKDTLPRDYKLAHEHVEWFLDMIHPLLISFMVHGHKHGKRDGERVEEAPVKVRAKRGRPTKKPR